MVFRDTVATSSKGFAHGARLNGFIELIRLGGNRVDRLRSYKVTIDGAVAGSIKDGETATFEVSPGQHHVQLRLDWWGRSPVVRVDVTEGQRLQLYCCANAQSSVAWQTALQDRHNYIHLGFDPRAEQMAAVIELDNGLLVGSYSTAADGHWRINGWSRELTRDVEDEELGRAIIDALDHSEQHAPPPRVHWSRLGIALRELRQLRQSEPYRGRTEVARVISGEGRTEVSPTRRTENGVEVEGAPFRLERNPAPTDLAHAVRRALKHSS